MSTPRFIDIHAIQVLPYSNINRDDIGAPKTVLYGGVERARVSSQSWKRVVRHAVEAAMGDPAVRTRRVVTEVVKRLTAAGLTDEVAAEGGRQVLAAASASGDPLKTEKTGETSALLFLPNDALDALTELVLAHQDEVAAQAGLKKPKAVLPADEVVHILGRRNISINMFGRMLAELPQTEVDGAVQVAHAFTVHRIIPEVDFFTAVDDVDGTDRGSAHMNSAQFVTGVFYRYASIGVRELTGNLGGDLALARAATSHFLDAFCRTVPTGKKNSTAPHTLPELVHVTVRADRPVSLAAAFEQPVPEPGVGFARPAQEQLAGYAAALAGMWGTRGLVLDGYAAVNAELAGLGRRHRSVDELIGAAVSAAYPAES